MPFDKGHKKLGGRKVGTPNRITKEVRTELKFIVYQELDKLPDYLRDLNSEKRIQVLLKLLPFVFPKVKEINYREGDPIKF